MSSHSPFGTLDTLGFLGELFSLLGREERVVFVMGFETTILLEEVVGGSSRATGAELLLKVLGLFVVVAVCMVDGVKLIFLV